MLNDLFYRLHALFSSREMDAEVEEELRDYLEREIASHPALAWLRRKRYAACSSRRAATEQVVHCVSTPKSSKPALDLEAVPAEMGIRELIQLVMEQPG